jgi:hypothetical protein
MRTFVQRRTVRFAGLIVAAAGFWMLLSGTAFAAPSPPFNQCPHVGFDNSCHILIYISDSGVQLLTDGSQGPYDGVEDTLIGVQNDTTGTTIGSVPVSSSQAIFGFDGDGICVSPNPTSGLPGINCSANGTDTTGYGGPGAYFTNINGAKTAGTVNFITPLAPGQSGFFSLEEPIDGSSLHVISATSTPISAVEGTSFSGQVATLHATDTSAPASQFTASIDWGDGNTSAGSVTGSGGTFTVSGTNTYVEEGNLTAKVTITDTSDGQTTTVSDSVTVADANLGSTCPTTAVSTQSFNGTTANLTDANAGAPTSDFTATIDWGDNTATSSGTVAGSTGSYTVSGNHSYGSTGYFTITTTINDDGGSTTTATCKTLVFAFAPGRGGFVIGNNNSTTGTAVTFWGPQWSKLNSLSGGPAPAAFKGYALNPATPACNVGWSTDPGNSTPPPAGPLPAFMGVIVSSHASQSGSQISGDTAHIVIVQTNTGYQPNVGHAGTGTVVAQVC